MMSETYISCGVKQLYDVGINTPREAIEEVYYAFENGEDYDYKKFSFIIFSDNVSIENEWNAGGERLARTIKRNKLGKIFPSSIRQNANYVSAGLGDKHRIKVWTWSYDHSAVKKYLKSVGRI